MMRKLFWRLRYTLLALQFYDLAYAWASSATWANWRDMTALEAIEEERATEAEG